MLASQKSSKPTRKIAVAGVTGALGTLIAIMLGVDEETAGAMAALVVFVVGAGYGTRERMI